MTDGDELLDTEQAAVYLTVSRATLYREHRKGRLALVKIAGSTRFRKSELDRYRAQRGRAVRVPTGRRRTPLIWCPMRGARTRGHAETPGICWLCGNPLPRKRRRWCSTACVRTWVDNHYWRAARPAAVRRDGGVCVRCGSAERIEVNHIRPLIGSGYGRGCVHHLSGLETLCRPHHVEETTRQARQRRGVM